MADRPSPNSILPAETEVPWERVEKFVGQVAHDLRNGLNALELQLTFLGEICVDPEAADECRQLRVSVGAVAKQLQALRLSTCAPAPLVMAYPAQDFFEDLRERFERLENAGSAKTRWEFALGKTMIAVDPELTTTALMEVLGNALRFGEGHTDFTLTVVTDEANARVTLTEHTAPGGPPIATENWGRQPLHSTRRGAYGLGLFRATRILDAQGCSISAVFSAADATLSTSILLPLGAPA